MATITIGRTLSAATDSVRADQGQPGSTPWPVRNMASLIPVAFDAIALTYTPAGHVATAKYYQGGTGGTLVATLTLSYTGDQLVSVTRT